MKLAFKVSAQELLEAGAPLTAIRQSYRPHDHYTEVTKTKTVAGATDAYIAYEATGSARDNFYYVLPAKDSAGEEVVAVAPSDTKTVVWKGSIKDSYVLVTTD
jgi:hypothetical protein